MHYESIKAFENDTRAPQRGDTIQASCGKAVWFYKGGSRWDLLTETFLDLSPLQKFMGETPFGFATLLFSQTWWDAVMYGFDWVPPAPSPEKSPQERALDDFIAKRKAKRDAPPNCTVPGSVVFDNSTSTERALDRAMRRLSFHEQDIHTRLMPYRREE